VSVLGGLFEIAHELVHLAIWLPSRRRTPAFDPGHSWLLDAVRRSARGLPVAAGALPVLAGVLVLAGADAATALAVARAAVSQVLVLLAFHPWLLRPWRSTWRSPSRR
jgi:hypothetical protein